MWGRFASPDPARDQHFEQTQSWNIYSYVQNSPTMGTDPTGMVPDWMKRAWNGMVGGLKDGLGLTPSNAQAAKAAATGVKDGLTTVAKDTANAVVPNEVWQKAGVDTSSPSLAEYAQNHSDAQLGGYIFGQLAPLAIPILAESNGAKVAAAGLETAEASSVRGPATLGEIFGNPGVLKNTTPTEVKALAQGEGWSVGTLGKGSQKGSGLIVRELGASGDPTGRMIQWHPGGGHHGAQPYWKVSSGPTGTVRVGPQFPE